MALGTFPWTERSSLLELLSIYRGDNVASRWARALCAIAEARILCRAGGLLQALRMARESGRLTPDASVRSDVLCIRGDVAMARGLFLHARKLYSRSMRARIRNADAAIHRRMLLMRFIRACLKLDESLPINRAIQKLASFSTGNLGADFEQSLLRIEAGMSCISSQAAALSRLATGTGHVSIACELALAMSGAAIRHGDLASAAPVVTMVSRFSDQLNDIILASDATLLCAEMGFQRGECAQTVRDARFIKRLLRKNRIGEKHLRIDVLRAKLCFYHGRFSKALKLSLRILDLSHVGSARVTSDAIGLLVGCLVMAGRLTTAENLVLSCCSAASMRARPSAALHGSLLLAGLHYAKRAGRKGDDVCRELRPVVQLQKNARESIVHLLLQAEAAWIERKPDQAIRVAREALENASAMENHLLGAISAYQMLKGYALYGKNWKTSRHLRWATYNYPIGETIMWRQAREALVHHRFPDSCLRPLPAFPW